MNYFVNRNGQQLGPFTEDQLKAKLASGEISPQDFVWWEGQADWKPIAQTTLGGGRGLPPGSPPMNPGVNPKTPGMAIASLVCGILGFFFSIFAAIPAIIMGHISLSRIRRDPTLGGHGIALTGTILGYVNVVIMPFIAIVAISVLIALGNQVKATQEQINQKLQEAQTNNAPAESPSSTTNSDSNPSQPTTNAPAATPPGSN